MELNTLEEKEKLLVSSNFTFSSFVFKRHVLQTHKNQGLFGKRLRGIFTNHSDTLFLFEWKILRLSKLKTSRMGWLNPLPDYDDLDCPN